MNLSNLGDYCQCITHNVNMTTDEELQSHSTDNCIIIPMTFDIKKTTKVRTQWISKRVREQYGLLIYKEDKKKIKAMKYTVPPGDMILVGDIDELIKESERYE